MPSQGEQSTPIVPVTIESLTRDVDRWRAMSRKNEQAFKDARRECEELRRELDALKGRERQ